MLHAVSTPDVSIAVPPGFFYIGVTNLTLTCIVSFNPATDSDVRLEDMDITWLRGDTELSNNGTQTTIMTVGGSQQPFTNNLNLSPLSLTDTVFTCRARARPPVGTSVITESKVGQYITTITIQCEL